jgi:hypothetical protein
MEVTRDSLDDYILCGDASSDLRWKLSCLLWVFCSIARVAIRLLETLQEGRRKWFELKRLCNYWCSGLYGGCCFVPADKCYGTKLLLVEELYRELLKQTEKVRPNTIGTKRLTCPAWRDVCNAVTVSSAFMSDKAETRIAFRVQAI